jgi:hypothetical protein
VTADNWDYRARSFVKARGNVGFVIRSPDAPDHGRPTPPQWAAWMAYCEDRGIPTAFAKRHGLMAVPCEWPEEFDIHVEPSERQWDFPVKRKPDPNMRCRIAALINRLANDLNMQAQIANRRDRPAQQAHSLPNSRAEAERIVAEGFPHLQAPVIVGDALRRSLGQPR